MGRLTHVAVLVAAACLRADAIDLDPARHVTRIAALRTRITVPLPADHPQRSALEHAAHACPVHGSLHPEIDAAVEFVWVG